jgi:predicted DNA repair protein MutK
MTQSEEAQENTTGGGFNIVTSVFIVVGALAGLLVVRSFMLEPIEEMGWRMFWRTFSEGNIGRVNMEMVFHSSTFGKSVVGVIVGGVVGFFAGKAFRPSKQQD